MRTLQRNKQTIYYAVLTDEIEIRDEEGNYTGEYEKTTSEPVKLRANIGTVQGQISNEIFGLIDNYSRVLIVDKNDFKLELTSNLPIVFWIDEKDITKSYDYRLIKMSTSLNGLALLVKKVNINGD